MTLRQAVESACERMGVALVVSEQRPPSNGSPWSEYGGGMTGRWLFGPPGPVGLYVDGDDRRVWLKEKDSIHDEGWMWVLHELEHIVFWHPKYGVDCDERLMMPWAVAALRAAGLSGSVYMKSAYTTATTIAALRHKGRRLFEVGDWQRPERAAWYLRAKAANIAAGTIDERGLPTWRYPDWEMINAKWVEK